MKKHFLVVDDSELNLRVVQTLLERNGIAADYVTSAEHAYSALAESDYDLIIMDYLMPGTNGIEATRHIRKMKDGHPHEYYRDIPVVALTAEDSEELRRAMLAGGINDILSKPIQQSSFSEMLSKWAPTIHGIDESTLMGMLDADRSSYLELVSIFCQDCDGKVSRINESLASGDYQGYTVEVHKIKSEAHVIGATGLAEAARILEFAGKAVTGVIPNGKTDEENKKDIKRDTPKIIKALKAIVGELRQLLEEGASGPESDIANAVPVTSIPGTAPAAAENPVVSRALNDSLEKLNRYVRHAVEALDDGDYSLTREWLGEISELAAQLLK